VHSHFHNKAALYNNYQHFKNIFYNISKLLKYRALTRVKTVLRKITTIDHLRNHISISLCPHLAPLVILTHTLVVCRMIARELRAILMQIILPPFPSSRSSVTSRMHCYFPCLLLSRVFFFPSSAERPFWAQLCRLYDFGAMWATHLCVCVHTSAYVYFIAVNHRLILPFRFLFCLSAAPWLTTLGRHVRDLLLPFLFPFCY